MNAITTFDISFLPALSSGWLIAFCLIALALLALSHRSLGWLATLRLICVVLFFTVLLNPSILEELRTPVKDTALIVVDRSASQNFENRNERLEAALASIQNRLDNAQEFMDARIIEVPEEAALSSSTQIFAQIEEAMADIPVSRRSGIIILSDGQIHDAPDRGTKPAYFEELAGKFGPVHHLITGDKNERDRRIKITKAPAFGINGQNIDVEFEVLDTPNILAESALVDVKVAGDIVQRLTVPIAQPQRVSLPINNAGQNVFEFSVADAGDELTLTNNEHALLVNGVRDRLRVLLVSGKPHIGERSWRNLLTSDPGVDLVHFTILREPSKLDGTPRDELSLIPFPFRELFEEKLYNFDLIIFDQYRLNRILPLNYFENIARYVQEGGAFLASNGPVFSTDRSIYQTGLRKIIPGSPQGSIIQRKFTPELTALGQQHPVTRNLSLDGSSWGPWLQMIPVNVRGKDILMSGAEGNPLLILDRVGEGRVAQIASDHLWLWARGYEDGGPYTELLRRTIHWLMKEPELDERALDVDVQGQRVTIRHQDYKGNNPEITITDPFGEQETITLESDGSGWLSGTYKADNIGVYSFENTQGQRRFAAVGETNPREFQDILSTKEPLNPLVEASGGTQIWLSQTPEPALRFTGQSRQYGSSSWLALRRNYDSVVSGVDSFPLLPLWLLTALLLSIIIGTWFLEGRRR